MIIEISETDLDWIIHLLYAKLAHLEKEKQTDFHDKYIKEIKNLIIRMNTIKEYYNEMKN